MLKVVKGFNCSISFNGQSPDLQSNLLKIYAHTFPSSFSYGFKISLSFSISKLKYSPSRRLWLFIIVSHILHLKWFQSKNITQLFPLIPKQISESIYYVCDFNSFHNRSSMFVISIHSIIDLLCMCFPFFCFDNLQLFSFYLPLLLIANFFCYVSALQIYSIHLYQSELPIICFANLLLVLLYLLSVCIVSFPHC